MTIRIRAVLTNMVHWHVMAMRGWLPPASSEWRFEFRLNVPVALMQRLRAHPHPACR